MGNGSNKRKLLFQLPKVKSFDFKNTTALLVSYNITFSRSSTAIVRKMKDRKREVFAADKHSLFSMEDEASGRKDVDQFIIFHSRDGEQTESAGIGKQLTWAAAAG
jgi:hypothetical protein